MIVLSNYNYLQTPNDVLSYGKRLGGICGEAAIAALLDINVKDVFDAWGIEENKFRGWTLQREMKIILNKLGYEVTQKSVKDKFILPDSDFAIIRVSFGKADQHWSITARESHYISIKRFNQGWYIYDNGIDIFDGKKINGIWIEKSEYTRIVMADLNMFVTSYLEVKRNEPRI